MSDNYSSYNRPRMTETTEDEYTRLMDTGVDTNIRASDLGFNTHSHSGSQAQSGMQYSPRTEENISSFIGVLMAFGVSVAAGIAMFIHHQRKPKTWRERIEDNVNHTLHEGRKVTIKAMNDLEKEFNELRKTVEKRMKDMR